MTILGPLADEPPEPMTKDEFGRVRKRLRTSWNGSLTLERKTVEQLLQEIIWLKKRLHRVEEAIEPLVKAIVDGEIIVITKALADFYALMFRAAALQNTQRSTSSGKTGAICDVAVTLSERKNCAQHS